LLLQNKARSDRIKPENMTGHKKEYAKYRLIGGGVNIQNSSGY